MLSFFPRSVLDEIWDLIESVAEGFPSLLCETCLGIHSTTQRQTNIEMLLAKIAYTTYMASGKLCGINFDEKQISMEQKLT